MPKVLNIHTDQIGLDDVNIMRRSPWGNPYKIGVDGNRAMVLWKYRVWINAQPMFIEKVEKELVGKNLVCCCAPNGCHGDILLEIANKYGVFR